MVKIFFKRLFFVIGLLVTLPLIVLTALETMFTGGKSEKIYGSCKELISLCPTIFGMYLRLGFYWAVCKRISPDADFQFGSMIAHRGTIIGAGSVIGCHSIIGRAEIGENVLIASRVSIISGKYQHGRPQDRTDNTKSMGEYIQVQIGDNCWIGESALILASIGSNCTVGAGSVVMKDFPDNSTIMGNPARKVNINHLDQAS
jgi:serine acetyltransferase